jgi:two-component system, NtrC family, response regulator AtoC
MIRFDLPTTPVREGALANRILVVDDEQNIRTVLRALLARDGHEVVTAADGAEAIAHLERGGFQAVLTDLRMPGTDGMTLLRHATAAWPGLPVVILTAHGTVDTAVEAIKRGAFDYLTKPFDHAEIRQVMDKALATEAAKERSRVGGVTVEEEPTDDPLAGIVGETEAMHQMFALMRKVAPSPTTLLIRGESGTGKELIATAIHELSDRADGSLIKLNCTAIPENLFESELFGHERGAFTGAVASKPGRFELASGGTLFLDEVGELPKEMQVKLLRVLQERSFERVGGIRSIEVDVRLIAATNVDLERLVESGEFRDDLYYRLNVVPITLPPLRERAEDIPRLMAHFLDKFNHKLGRQVREVAPAAMRTLMRYAWPGNIRELENLMERVILLLDGDVVGAGDLPQELFGEGGRAGESGRHRGLAEELPIDAGESLKEIVRVHTEELERDLIERALEAEGWNVTHTAQRLGISRKGLQLKMKDYGLRRNGPE